jgi:hypothetical protein
MKARIGMRATSKVLCLLAAWLYALAPAAWAQEHVSPMVGIQVSWGADQPRQFRIGSGVRLELEPAGLERAHERFYGTGSRSIYTPLWSMPVGGGSLAETEMGEQILATQAADNQRSSGVAIGAALVVGGLVALVLIARNRLDDQASGSGGG